METIPVPILRLSRSDLIRFIDKYREMECLWNSASPLYKKADLKPKAWLEIANTFNINVESVKRKIKSLRGTFILEKKKLHMRNNETKNNWEKFESTLFWYDRMNFLSDVITIKEGPKLPKLEKMESINVDSPNRSYSSLSSLPFEEDHDILQYNVDHSSQIVENHENSPNFNFNEPKTIEISNINKSNANLITNTNNKQTHQFSPITNNDAYEEIHEENSRSDYIIEEINYSDNQTSKIEEIEENCEDQQDDEMKAFSKFLELSLRKLPEIYGLKAMKQCQKILTKYRIKTIKLENRLKNKRARNFIPESSRKQKNIRTKRLNNCNYESS